MSGELTCPICFVGDMCGGSADELDDVRDTAEILCRHGWLTRAELATVRRILTDMERDRMGGVFRPADERN